MPDPRVDAYLAAFAARCEAARRPGQEPLDAPGIRGLLPSPDAPVTRLLVTDDRAYGVLGELLPGVRAGLICVFAAAPRCAELAGTRTGWKPSTATAMVSRDLRTVPAPALPGGLTLRPVRRTDDDPPGGVPLADAVAAVLRADASMDDPPETFADYLRSLPPTVRLLCAVDAGGAVRATSGCDTFGTDANVFFVDTDPDWRGRGIGRAMTAAALHAARRSGARRACLDASGAGLSIYRRLGFETVARTTRYSRWVPAAAWPDA